MLHYPTAVYFFVNRSATALAERIRAGLEAAIADGRFDDLFREVNGKAIEQAQLDARVVLLLDNPLLPAETPLHRQELWYKVRRP